MGLFLLIAEAILECRMYILPRQDTPTAEKIQCQDISGFYFDFQRMA